MAMNTIQFPNPESMPRRVRGLSLIEVLIALLVLSIGLVGMASLQLTSLKSAHSSYYRSLASAAALDTEERLWLRLRETVLADPATNPPFCMPAATMDKVLAESQTAWQAPMDGSSSKAGIPNLAIVRPEAPEETPNSREDTSNGGVWTYRWQQIPIRLTWTENRLGEGADGDFTESFDYVIRIPCVAEWTPPS